MEIWIFKISFFVCGVLLIVAAKKATNRAQLKHDCSFDKFNSTKTEVPILLWIRGILGIPSYVFLIEWLLPNTYFHWSYLQFPMVINWVGLVLLIGSISLLWWSLKSIKTNYHGTIGLHTEHELITTGAYHYIRHPIVVSFLLFHISVFLLSSNWVLGVLLIPIGVSVCIIRAPVEEKFLTERFGDRYKDYMKRTGKFFPKI